MESFWLYFCQNLRVEDDVIAPSLKFRRPCLYICCTHEDPDNVLPGFRKERALVKSSCHLLAHRYPHHFEVAAVAAAATATAAATGTAALAAQGLHEKKDHEQYTEYIYYTTRREKG